MSISNIPQQETSLITSDPQYIQSLTSHITTIHDSDELQSLMSDVTETLDREMVQSLLDALYPLCLDTRDIHSLTAASATCLHIAPALAADNIVITAILRGLRTDDPFAQLTAATALADLPGTVRIQPEVLSALVSCAVDDRADTRARCIALGALACAHNDPSVRITVTEIAQDSSIPKLKMEAAGLLSLWRHLK